ncbi:MAG TPA: hypothetical protein VMU51_04085 [Mycobacteriales bacterium]|nr:hypothetical protein [Mycobacteriales bacterium]
MRPSRRGVETVATRVIVVVWVVFYAIALATADQLPGPVTAVVQLLVPPLLGVGAARLVLRQWWSGIGSRMAALDLPGRLLAAEVAALPEHRREWGRAMTAELAEVQGRSARWRFALSTARATLWQPPSGGWPVLALVAGVAVALAAAAGPAVGAAVPGLTVFTVTFTGLVGAMVALAVVRWRRPRLPVPAPTVLVTAGVAAAIGAIVIFLRREPAAARYLPPAAAVYLAIVLAGCLWLAVASARWLGTSRLAPHLGAAGAVVFAVWFLLAFSSDGAEPPLPLVLLLAVVLMVAPAAAFFVPAFVAGRVGRSFRSGLQAAVWTVIAAGPLTYALWLPAGLHRHAIDGRTLDGELVAPVGENLPAAMVFCLGIFPVLGLTVAVIGAGLGARPPRPPAAAPPQPQT